MRIGCPTTDAARCAGRASRQANPAASPSKSESAASGTEAGAHRPAARAAQLHDSSRCCPAHAFYHHERARRETSRAAGGGDARGTATRRPGENEFGPAVDADACAWGPVSPDILGVFFPLVPRRPPPPGRSPFFFLWFFLPVRASKRDAKRKRRPMRTRACARPGSARRTRRAACGKSRRDASHRRRS